MTILAFIVSAAALAAYVCRLDSLNWRKHRATFVVAHLAHAIACALVMTQAAQGKVGWAGGLSLLAAIIWLAVTFKSWRNGPPEYACRPAPAPARRSRIWFEA